MALLLVASVAVAVLAYVPLLAGLAVSMLFALAVGLVLYAYGNAVVQVTDDALVVGRSRIEGRWLADAEALAPAEAALAMGPAADTRDFLQTRPYIKALVRITLDDPADPHPHWLVSSRDPEGLARAVRALAGAQA